ncbi:Ribonuclease H-like superfamily [Sesbania bispinosa]|nr:Ribonuclease H-like superfamily [Sesbania bispinosa]
MVLVRDHLGRWTSGFQQNLGAVSVLMAMLRGILNSLILCWNLGARKVVLECDSAVAVQLIREGVHQGHPYEFILQRIGLLLAKEWEVKVVHVWREANGVADHLANSAHGGSFELRCLHSPLPLFLVCCFMMLWGYLGPD